MDAVVSAARVQCPHDGCERFVADHKSVCPHAPCLCTEPGCGFVAPPAALVEHLLATHSMPVHRVSYGKPNRIQVPVLGPARRVLVGAGDGLFMLTVSALGVTTIVSAVCVRGDACVLPRYTVKMWKNGPTTASRRTDTVLADVEATSSATPGAVALEDLTSFLTVPPRGTSSGRARPRSCLCTSASGRAPPD
ncbi:hypothetical protein ACUV84_041862 [Puccinellia chinampoensis]